MWFNAWHHREEQNVLASIVENIHKQAIKPWWHPAGLWFRLRLLWQRHWLWKAIALVSLASILFLSAWLYKTDTNWEHTKRYGFYLAKIERPVVLGEKGFRQLCSSWAAEHGYKVHSVSFITPRKKPESEDLFESAQCEILHDLHSHERVKRNDLACAANVRNVGAGKNCFASPDVLFKTIEDRMQITLTASDHQGQITRVTDHQGQVDN